MDKLSISASLDDCNVGLTGKLSVKDFSGYGEGWFNKSDVLRFCEDLRKLVLERSGNCELVGSQCKPDGSEYLERLGLRCYVLAASKLNGVVGLHVTMSHYPYTDCREQEILKVSGELQVRNGPMQQFADDLQELVDGKLNEATILGDLNII
jgi:hypothetical protein